MKECIFSLYKTVIYFFGSDSEFFFSQYKTVIYSFRGSKRVNTSAEKNDQYQVRRMHRLTGAENFPLLAKFLYIQDRQTEMFIHQTCAMYEHRHYYKFVLIRYIHVFVQPDRMKQKTKMTFRPYQSNINPYDCVCMSVWVWVSLVTTRPIPYLHQTSSVLRKLPLELLCVLLE